MRGQRGLNLVEAIVLDVLWPVVVVVILIFRGGGVVCHLPEVIHGNVLVVVLDGVAVMAHREEVVQAEAFRRGACVLEEHVDD